MLTLLSYASFFRPAPRTALMAADAAFSFRAELGRKALHLLALGIPLSMAWIGAPLAVWIVTAAALIGVTGDVLRAVSPQFRALIRTVFGGLMRPSEWADAEGRITLNGATCVLVACALAGWLFPVAVAVPALCAALLADAAAAIVGRRLGRHPWGDHGRTAEGSAAFVVMAAVVLAGAGLPLVAVGAAALVGAVLEALPLSLNDNIAVPLGMGTVLAVLG
jgi:dolichol kinase